MGRCHTGPRRSMYTILGIFSAQHIQPCIDYGRTETCLSGVYGVPQQDRDSVRRELICTILALRIDTLQTQTA